MIFRTSIFYFGGDGYLGKFIFNIRKYKFLYALMVPGVVYYVVFCYLPMYGVVIAFQNFIPYKGILHSEWVGFDHFRSLFSSALFIRVLENTILISLYKLIWGFPIPILFALALNEVRQQAFKRIIQSVSYLPNFISWVIISGIVYVVFNEHFGALAKVAGWFGIDYVNMSRDPDLFREFLVLTSIWKTAGWSSIIYLAALTNIDPELYEAARIDGASRMQLITKISIPCIAPIIAIVLIFSVGSILTQDFEQIYILSGENPSLLAVSDTFESYVFREGIKSNNFSFPAAVGIFQSFFGMWLILGVNKFSKKLGYGGIW